MLPLGVEILCAALSLLQLPGFMLCDWGLREGIVLDTHAAGAARRRARRARQPTA